MKEIVFESKIPGTENLRALPIKNVLRLPIMVHKDNEPKKIVPDYLVEIIKKS